MLDSLCSCAVHCAQFGEGGRESIKVGLLDSIVEVLAESKLFLDANKVDCIAPDCDPKLELLVHREIWKSLLKQLVHSEVLAGKPDAIRVSAEISTSNKNEIRDLRVSIVSKGGQSIIHTARFGSSFNEMSHMFACQFFGALSWNRASTGIDRADQRRGCQAGSSPGAF